MDRQDSSSTPDSTPDSTLRPWRGRFVVLAGIVLAAFNLRIAVASVSPILDVVRTDIDLSDQVAGLLGTVPVIAFAVFGSLVPVLSRRFGLEPTLVAALVVSSVGEILRSLSSTAPSFLLWTAVALAGMGMGNVLLPPLVKRYFPDRIGAVTAAYTVTLSLSTAIPPLLVVGIASSLGWRPALGGWALVGLLAAVPWTVVIARSARARAELASVLEHSPEHTAGLDGRHRHEGRAWRSPLAWGIAGMFGLNSLNTYVMFAWLPHVLIDAGMPEPTAATALALYAFVGMPMSIVTPLLAARMRNPYPLVVVFVAMLAVGYGGLMGGQAGPATWVWVVLAGLGASTFPLGLALINLRSRTSAGAVALSGFVQGVGYLLAGAGPLTAGILYGRSGTWDSTFVVLFGTLVVILVAAVAGCRPVMIEDTWAPRARRGRPPVPPADVGTNP
ncbi:CynX/NimT family MFS transporter [Oerskovia sp. NPDC057915]|uniref:MFS transporter n=1 Tax=Oerskovia sp. NPDC057915 TaxID=3346280 RepID=UPI0036DF5AAD